MKNFFNYIKGLWEGADGKPSVRVLLALIFSGHFMHIMSFAVRKWDANRSLEGLSIVLGIEAGLIASLLTLTTIQNIKSGLTKTTETTGDPLPSTKETVTVTGTPVAVEQVK